MDQKVNIICCARAEALFKMFEKNLKGDGYLVITPNINSGREVISHLLKSPGFKDSFSESSFTSIKRLCADVTKEICPDKVVISSTSAKEILKDIVHDLSKARIFHPIKECSGLYDDLYRLIIKFKENRYSPGKGNAYHSSVFSSFIDIYEAYNMHLRENGLIDEADEVTFAKDKFGSSSIITENNELHIVGFVHFLKFEESIITKLAKQFNKVNIYLYHDGRDKHKELYSHTEGLITRLKDKLGAKIVTLPADPKRDGSNLDHVKENLFITYEAKAGASEDDGSVEVTAAIDIKDEVKVLAIKIRKLLEEDGYSPDDIAVVVRNKNDYAKAIEASFKEYGIPSDLKSAILITPLNIIKTVMQPLYLVFKDFLRDDVTSFLGSDYIRMKGDPDIDLIELILNKAGIIKGALSYETKLDNLSSVLKDEARNDIKSTKKYMSDLIKMVTREIKPEDTVSNYKNSLKTLLEDRFKIKEGMVNGHEQALPELIKRDIYAYAEFFSAFDELIQAYKIAKKSDEKIPISKLIDLLSGLLEGRTIKFNENSSYSFKDFGYNTAVRIFSPDDMFIKSYKALFVLGMTYDTFPKNVRPSFLLGGDDESFSFLIRKEDILASERLFFLRLVSLSQDKLYISYIKGGSNELTESSGGRSPFVEDLLMLVSERVEKESVKVLSGPYVKKSRNDILSNFFSKLSESTTGDKKHLFYHILSTDTDGMYKRVLSNIGAEYEREESEEFTPYEGNLSDQPEELKKKLKEKIESRTFSASQLDTFANCPISYFFDKVLYLNTVEVPELGVQAKDKGTMLHDILFRYFSSDKRLGMDTISELTDSGIEAYILAEQKIIEKIADVYFDEKTDEHAPMDPHMLKVEKKNVIDTLKNVVAHEVVKKFEAFKKVTDYEKKYEDALKKSEKSRLKGTVPKYVTQAEQRLKNAKDDTLFYEPKYFEYGFGTKRSNSNGENSGEHSLTDFGEVKIDIDNGDKILLRGYIDRIDVNEDGTKFVIIDYKSGSHPQKKEVKNGKSFQLPIYEEYVEKEFLKGLTPECGIYYNLSIPKRTEIDVRFEEVRPHLTECINAMKAGEFFIKPHECKSYCQYSSICRYAGDSNGFF